MIFCYAANVGTLFFLNIRFLKKLGNKNCGNNRQEADDDRTDRVDFRPLEALVLNVALSFGCMNFIWFVAFRGNSQRDNRMGRVPWAFNETAQKKWNSFVNIAPGSSVGQRLLDNKGQPLEEAELK